MPEHDKFARISDLAKMLRSAINIFDDSGDLLVDTFSPRVSRFDPDAAIMRVVDLFANEDSTVKFRKHERVRETPQKILGDMARMQQVLLILLNRTLDNNIFDSEVYVSASHTGELLTVIVSNSQKQGGRINMRRRVLSNIEASLG